MENLLERLPTGIPGFDEIADGGLTRGRSTLVLGTPGSAKTVFAAQFLAEGIIRANQPGVFVTFEENPRDIVRNLRSFGWDIDDWQRRNLWRFVDAPARGDDAVEFVGAFDLDALISRIEHAIRSTGAQRVALDSIRNLYYDLPDGTNVRRELNRIISRLKALGVTQLITAEQSETTLHMVEEFVTDNVILLRNELDQEKRRRTIEILKLRGGSHQKGPFSFTILDGTGLQIIPLSAIELNQPSSQKRISSGSPDLDQMLGGGLFQDSIVLVSGPTGCGKTLAATHFISAQNGPADRPRLYLAFEESRDQLFRNAQSWGIDLQAHNLIVECMYPETQTLEDHLVRIKRLVDRYRPGRLVVDSLTALERITTMKAFREFVINVTSFVKQQQTAGIFTATTPALLGGESISESHISSMTDTILLLRYVEVLGEIRRGLTVLKMRGSAHDKRIREFTIDNSGMHLGQVFANVTGIIGGNPNLGPVSEADRLNMLFPSRE